MIAGQPGKLVEQRRLYFFGCLLIPGLIFPVVYNCRYRLFFFT
jgi:hypothetical protein